MEFTKHFEEKYGYLPVCDNGQWDAAKNYFMFGLSPGSCTSAIIRGDLEDALARAHPHLKSPENFPWDFNGPAGITPLEVTYHAIRELLGEIVCDYSHNPDYGHKFPGINNIYEHEQAMIFLECPWVQGWMKEAQDAEFIR